MSPLARVQEEHAGEVAIAAVDGEIDASNARDLGERLRSSLTNHSRTLVVDLGATTYVDSAGINLLFGLDLELRQRRQHLRLVVTPGSPIEHVLEIAGLTGTVPTHPGRDDALRAAAADGT